MSHEIVNHWLASGYLVTGIVCMTSVTIVAWKIYKALP